MKNLAKLLSALCIIGMLAGCSTAKQTLKIGGPTAPPSLPILRMMDSKALGENITLEFTKWNAVESLMAMVNDSSVDFLALPLNNAVFMYNKGMDVQLMNVNTWAVMSMITADPAIKGWDDLRGKTLFIPMKSSPVDFITQTFMKEHGLIPGQNLQTQYTNLSEGTQLLLSGQAQVIVGIEPMVTAAKLKNPDIRSIVDYQQEWEQLTQTDTSLPNAGLATRSKLAKQNPKIVARFQTEYEKALKWVVEHPAETGALAAKYLGMDEDIIAAAVPNMALQFKSAADSRKDLERYYNILFAYSPESIGGKLPDESFFYIP